MLIPSQIEPLMPLIALLVVQVRKAMPRGVYLLVGNGLSVARRRGDTS